MLLDDYFPIGADYFLEMTPQEINRVTQIVVQDGICQYCQMYASHYDERMLIAEKQMFVEDVQAQPPALLALSGGKDSLTALYLLVEILQVQTHAFLYQNGFIPDFIVEKAREFCDFYQVPLTVVERPLYQQFRQEYALNGEQLVARTGLDFCYLCSGRLNQISFDLCDQLGAQWVVLGNKVYTQLKPYVSSIAWGTLQGRRRQSINLLYTLGIQNIHQQYILKKMGWTDPGLPGYTSNCWIPGLVEQARRQRLQAHPDQGYIERELRSGAYTPSQAQVLLQKDHLQVSWQDLPPDLQKNLTDADV